MKKKEERKKWKGLKNGVRRGAGSFIGRGDGLQPCVQFRFRHTVLPVFVWAYCAAAVTKRCGSGVPAQYRCGNPAYRCPLAKPQSQWRPLAFWAAKAVPLQVESQWWNSCTGTGSPARKSMLSACGVSAA